MYARVTTTQSAPGSADEIFRYIDEKLRPAVMALGCLGLDALGDPHTGHGYSITFWKDAEAARASDAAATQLREQARQDLSAQVLDVHTYEVTVEEAISGLQPRAARVTPAQGDSSRVDEFTRWTETQVLPSYRTQPGFCGWHTLTDRQTGKSLIISLWESEATMQAAEALLGQSRDRATQEMGVRLEPTQRYTLGAQAIVQPAPTQQHEAHPE